MDSIPRVVGQCCSPRVVRLNLKSCRYEIHYEPRVLRIDHWNVLLHGLMTTKQSIPLSSPFGSRRRSFSIKVCNNRFPSVMVVAVVAVAVVILGSYRSVVCSSRFLVVCEESLDHVVG